MAATCVTRENIASFSVEELCSYLADQGLDSDVMSILRDSKITGLDFLELSKDLLKELFPVVGVRMSVSRLLSSLTPKPAEIPLTSTLPPKVFICYCKYKPCTAIIGLSDFFKSDSNNL